MKKNCVALLLVCLPLTVVAAELVVIKSNSPDYLVGTILDSEKPIVLDDSAAILLIAEDGIMVSLMGPYVGPPGRDETPGAPGVLDSLRRLVGYAEIEARDIGGVRGDAAGDNFLATQIDDDRESAWLLHTGITGSQCVRDGAEQVEYWRQRSDNAERLYVKRVTTGESVSLDWEAAHHTLVWPQALPLVADEMYLLRLGDQLRSTNLLLQEVPGTVGDDGVAAVAFLAAKGCVSQARVELKRLTAQSNEI